MDIYLKIDEGKKYYIRNITWVGNTVYTTDYLSRLLNMKKGDVYNQTYLQKRLTGDDDAVGNEYWNNGYIFYSLTPTEVNIVGDSIDLEMRIYEGQQAHISHVRINGNDRLYENVVRRELRTKPETCSRRRPSSVLHVSWRAWAISTRGRHTGCEAEL